jgi:hypothetical protein
LAPKHSVCGKISFTSLIVCLISITLNFVNTAISDYSFYATIPLLDTLNNFVQIFLYISCLFCFILGIVSMFEKNTKKVLPLISLSITSFLLYLGILSIIQNAATVLNVDKGIVTNYGIFDIPFTVSNNDTTYDYDQRYLKNNTEDIPAEIGTRFGFNYVITGDPDGGKIKIMKITRYPKPGRRKAGELIATDTTYFSVYMNRVRYSGYVLEYSNELITGNWEFEFWYKGRKILTKIFKLYSKS